MVDRSWNLLAPAGQAAMRALSVFPGGFAADAAVHLLGDDGRVLEQLVDQSLLKVDDTPSGTRFSMLETGRAFSAAHRDAAGETARVLDRFLAWARDFGVAHQDVASPEPATDTVRNFARQTINGQEHLIQPSSLGSWSPTDEGTPQGGVISPVLLNIALHGLEAAAGVRYRLLGNQAAQTEPGSPVLIRYADDLIAICHSREQTEQVKARLAGWLAPRGLVFNEDKTRIVHLTEGCDFLGFNVRRYPNGKLLIKPSRQAIRRLRERLTSEMRSLHGANALAVIRRINPILRGWCAYYRTVVAKDVFSTVDDHVWQLTHRWALHTHPHKSKKWVIDRYFGPFHPSRQDRWVFGDRDSGIHLTRAAWTKIVRHRMVAGTSSPDDPALIEYWAQRRRKQAPLPLDSLTLRLLQTQAGRCPRCEDPLLDADMPQSPQQWEQWLRVARRAIKKERIARQGRRGPTDDDIRLVHAHCRQHQHRHGHALVTTCEPVRLA